METVISLSDEEQDTLLGCIAHILAIEPLLSPREIEDLKLLHNKVVQAQQENGDFDHLD